MPGSQASPSDVALAVTGAGLALMLHQRSVFVLHGSCVEVGGGALCFAGTSGAGKSTLASALCERGHRLVSDGMTAVQSAPGVAHVLPGWPGLKLLPDSARHLGWEIASAPRVHAQSDKVLCASPAGVVVAPTPLQHVFVVETADAVSETPLSPSAATIELLRHFFLEEVRSVDQATILSLAAALAAQVSVSRLTRGTDLASLDELVLLAEARALNG